MLLTGALKHAGEHQSTFRDVLKVTAESRLITGKDHEVFLNLFKWISLEHADLSSQRGQRKKAPISEGRRDAFLLNPFSAKAELALWAAFR